MKDCDIRQVLLSDLERKYGNDPDTIVVEELGLCQGESRIDIAVINGTMHGIEIKSDEDTLKRLPIQMEFYNRSFDTVTLVVGSKHLKSARQIIPKWWGVVEAKENGNETTLTKRRKDRKNPKLDPEAIVQLLWRDEAIEILKRRNLQHGYISKTKWEIFDRLIEKLSVFEIQSEVRNHLKSRENWRSDLQPV